MYCHRADADDISGLQRVQTSRLSACARHIGPIEHAFRPALQPDYLPGVRPVEAGFVTNFSRSSNGTGTAAADLVDSRAR